MLQLPGLPGTTTTTMHVLLSMTRPRMATHDSHGLPSCRRPPSGCSNLRAPSCCLLNETRLHQPHLLAWLPSGCLALQRPSSWFWPLHCCRRCSGSGLQLLPSWRLQRLQLRRHWQQLRRPPSPQQQQANCCCGQPPLRQHRQLRRQPRWPRQHCRLPSQRLSAAAAAAASAGTAASCPNLAVVVAAAAAAAAALLFPP